MISSPRGAPLIIISLRYMRKLIQDQYLKYFYIIIRVWRMKILPGSISEIFQYQILVLLWQPYDFHYRPLALILDNLPLCDCALVQFKDASVGDRFLFRSMGHIRQWWWLCGPAFQAFCPHTKTVPRLLWRCPRCRVVTQTPFDNWILIWGPFPPIQLVLNLWGLFN